MSEGIKTALMVFVIIVLFVFSVIGISYKDKTHVSKEDYLRSENARVNCQKIYNENACIVFKRFIDKCLDDGDEFHTCVTVNKYKLTDFDLKNLSKEKLDKSSTEDSNSTGLIDHVKQGVGVGIGIQATKMIIGK